MKLTKKYIETLIWNGKAQHIVWDDEVKGFGVRLYPTGKKSFVLSYRDNNRKSIMVLGDAGLLKVDQARDKAKQFLVGLINGVNPLSQQRKVKQGTLIKDLCLAYIERHASIRNQVRMTYLELTDSLCLLGVISKS